MKQRFFIICILLCFAGLANAAGYHDMSQISKQVKDYLYNLPEIKQDKDTLVKVHSFDRRLKLAKCNRLDFNIASGAHLSGKTSVRVICKSPKSWSFYITASISRYDEVYLSNGTFSRGHILRESDVYKSRKDLSRLPFGYITQPSDVIGKQLKRSIQAGRILSPSQLNNPLVIKRGDIISLQSLNRGFSVSMKGVAMVNGAIGDNIRVKNTSSKRIVEGKVIKPGIVMIIN